MLLSVPQIARKKLLSKKRVFVGSQNVSNNHYIVSFEFSFLRCRSKGFALWWICLFRLLSLPRGIQERIVSRRKETVSGNIQDFGFFLTPIFHLFYTDTCFIWICIQFWCAYVIEVFHSCKKSERLKLFFTSKLSKNSFNLRNSFLSEKKELSL